MANQRSSSGSSKSSGSRTTAKSTKSNTKSSQSKNTARRSTASAGSKTAAGTSKRGSGSSSARTSARRRERYEEPEYQEQSAGFPYLKEIIMLLILLVCVVMFLGNFGIGGIVGEYLSGFSMGIMGKYLGYIFPVVLFIGTAYFLYRWYDTKCWIRMAGLFLMLFSICGMCEAIANTKDSIAGLKMIADSTTSAGGIFGIMMTKLLLPGIGKPGTIILYIVMIVIGVLLLTGQSLRMLYHEISDRVYKDAIEEREYSRRMAEERLKQRQQHREEAARQANNSVPVTGRARGLMPPIQESGENSARGAGSDVKSRRLAHQAEEERLKQRVASRTVSQPSAPAENIAAEKEANLQNIPINGMYEQPKTARKRPLQGVTTNTKIRQDRPSDFQAKELLLGGEEETEQIQIVAKSVGNQSGNRKVRRMSYESDIDSAADIFSPENMSKTAPDVVPPPVIRPQLKPKKDTRTLTELEQLDDAGAGYRGTTDIPISIAGLDKNGMDFESPSDVYARKKELNQEYERAAWNQQEENVSPKQEEAHGAVSSPGMQDEDDEVGYRTVTTATGKVIKARLNVTAGEKQLTAADKQDGMPGAKDEHEDEKIEFNTYEEPKEYVFPPIDLLARGSNSRSKQALDRELRETASKLQQTLTNFGVGVTITNISCGPTVTRYELQPEMGVKVSKIVALTDDIKLNLAAADIRMEAPIPGKAAIGIEVPNRENVTVMLRDLLESEEFESSKSKISFAVGKDIGGQTMVADIGKMPHLLIAGATGSGKSVCINTLIVSILYKAKPSEVKMIMIDPKVVELSIYNGIPHLLIPVVTDAKKAAGALNWAVAEMEDRYKKFAEYAVRDLKGYNEKIDAAFEDGDKNKPEHMAQIVIIVDELADLMMVAPGDVEDAIIRLAQKARAAGIHLIIATQRPSVNVITGLIKANVPSRIAFAVSSGVDSRTILDMNGAEKLLGKGDMLFAPIGIPKPVRVQGAFVSDQEVSAIVDFLSQQKNVIGGRIADIQLPESSVSASGAAATAMAAGMGSGTDNGLDDLFIQAGKFIIEKDKASIGMLQRMFRIGFNRAARIMDQLADAGVVGEEEGTKPRKILMTEDEFDAYIDENLS